MLSESKYLTHPYNYDEYISLAEFYDYNSQVLLLYYLKKGQKRHTKGVNEANICQQCCKSL